MKHWTAYLLNRSKHFDRGLSHKPDNYPNIHKEQIDTVGNTDNMLIEIDHLLFRDKHLDKRLGCKPVYSSNIHKEQIDTTINTENVLVEADRSHEF